MVDTEKLTDFPRHGQRRKNNTDNTRIRKKRVMTDDLFKSGKEELSNKPKKSKERKKKTDIDEEDEVAVIEELNVRSLPIGCIVFGCIQEIREFEMKMTLPGDIQCVIPITNISELYTESLENFANDEISTPPLKLKSMFRIGECFPVKVLEKKEDNHTFQGVAVNRIHVVGSLDPKDIYEDVVSSTFAKCCNHVTMSAVVESVEDHGYIMDIGLKGLKAFMSKDDSEPFLEKLNVNSLTVGQLMLCEVKSCDNRIIKLGAVTKNTITGSESVHFSASCLLPGLRISATVMDVSEKGLHVMVLNEFKGFVHKNHLKSVWDLPTRDYKIAQNVKGTILYRNPLTKLVAITLRKMDPESLTQNWHGIRAGKIIKKATVVGKEETGTVVFKFKPGLKAVIPKNQLADEFLTTAEFTDLDNKLEIGTKHMFRIKSICYIDGYAMGSLKPSILSKDDISVEDIEIGNFVIGKVKRLTDQGLVVQLGYNIQGFVPTIHLAESANVQNPEKLYPLDKEVKCRVIRIDKNVEPPKIVLTCKKSLLKKNLLIIDYFNKAEIGMETDGVIALINEHGILIELFNGVRGFAPLNLLSEAKITNAHSMFKVGQVVHCTVISTIPTQRKMILSLIGIRTREDQSSQGKRKRSTTDTEELGSPKKTKDTDEEDCVKKMKSVEKDGSSKPTVDDIEVGNFVVGKVKRLTDQGLVVQLGYNQAFVPSIHLAESSNVQNLEKLYPLDKEVKCRVIRIEKNVKHPKIVLTCKKSLLKKNLLIIDYFNKAETGMETDGVIALINEHGLLIELFNGVRGFAPLNLLSEAKITDANTMFKVGQVVHCTVISTIPSKRKMILSLIGLKTREDQSLHRKRNRSTSDTDELEEKTKDTAEKETIKGSEECVKKMKSKKSELAKKSITMLVEKLAKISRKEQLKRKRKDTEESINDSLVDEQSESSAPVSKKKKKSKTLENKIEESEDTSKIGTATKSCLPVAQGFEWDDNEENASDNEGSDSSDDENTKTSEKRKKSRKERNEEARKKEEYLRQREEILMDKQRAPETVDDFERKVMSSPNSSIVWIHYIAFHLEAGEIEKARSIAERALITISFREENEKFNIWVAMLNLENEFGDEESLNAVFTRALQMNEPLKVYKHMVRIYEDAQKLKEAEQMFELMCRKFKKEKEVWVLFALYFMRHNENEKARKLLDKSLKSIEMRHHVDLISKFAQIEFQFGEFERGKTMFDNLVSNYPKRVDLWSIFIDMMIKYGAESNSETLSSIRSVFERAITLKLNVKKMRVMFKKYLDFEMKYGNEDTVSRVRQKAKEYVDENPLNDGFDV